MGVMSLIATISSPAAWIARMADSLPVPGPFTKTSTCRMPCSIAFFAAVSAANWDAKGVLFRDPLNPLLPELDHVRTLPAVSVMVTIVLLNDAWMWAMPFATFFLSLPFFAIGSPVFLIVPQDQGTAL